MPTSIIDVDVRDDRFKAFLALFDQYRKAVESLPAEWKDGADAAAEVTKEFAEAESWVRMSNKALADQANAVDDIARREAKARAETIQEIKLGIEAQRAGIGLERDRAALEAQTDRSRRERSKEDAKVAQQHRKEESDHQRKTETSLKDVKNLTKDIATNGQSIAAMFGGVAGGILGASSIAGVFSGIWGAASGVGSQRTAAQSLGATAGELKAFGTTYGRVGLDPSFVGAVADMANDPSRAGLFAQMGIPEAEVDAARQSGDYGALAAHAVSAAKQKWDTQGPEGRSQSWLNTTGLGQPGLGLDLPHWRGIGTGFDSQQDADRAASQFARDSASANIPDRDQRSYQDLASSLERLANDFEAKFLTSNFAESLSRAANDLDEIVKNRGWTGLFKTDVPNSPVTPDIPYKYTLPGMLGVPERWMKDHPLPGSGPSSWLPNWLKPYVGGNDASGGASTDSSGTPDLATIGKKFGLPPGMLEGIAQVESGTTAHPKDTFDGGEWHRGMFQMSDSMLKRLNVNDPYDANSEAMAAGKEMSDYVAHFHGNVQAAIAAWNAGEGGVDRAITRAGETNFPNALKDGGAYIDRVISALQNLKVEVTVDNRAGANVQVSANAVAPQR